MDDTDEAEDEKAFIDSIILKHNVSRENYSKYLTQDDFDPDFFFTKISRYTNLDQMEVDFQHWLKVLDAEVDCTIGKKSPEVLEAYKEWDAVQLDLSSLKATLADTCQDIRGVLNAMVKSKERQVRLNTERHDIWKEMNAIQDSIIGESLSEFIENSPEKRDTTIYINLIQSLELPI